MESADIIGVTAVSIALRTVFVSIYSSAYQAKGRFRLTLWIQLIDLAVLIPVCMWAVHVGFWQLVYYRAFVRLVLIPVEIVFAWQVCSISIKDTVREVYQPFIATAIMGIIGFLIADIYASVWWKICSVFICIVAYFMCLFLNKRERETYFNPIIKKVFKKRNKYDEVNKEN